MVTHWLILRQKIRVRELREQVYITISKYLIFRIFFPFFPFFNFRHNIQGWIISHCKVQLIHDFVIEKRSSVVTVR